MDQLPTAIDFEPLRFRRVLRKVRLVPHRLVLASWVRDMSERSTVEILTFSGCPNAQAARELVEQVVADERLDVNVVAVDVRDVDDAERHRFLGSPTIRVGGRDVEPGADDRTEYAFACRVYRTQTGLTGVPEEGWLRDALARS